MRFYVSLYSWYFSNLHLFSSFWYRSTLVSYFLFTRNSIFVLTLHFSLSPLCPSISFSPSHYITSHLVLFLSLLLFHFSVQTSPFPSLNLVFIAPSVQLSIPLFFPLPFSIFFTWGILYSPVSTIFTSNTAYFSFLVVCSTLFLSEYFFFVL